MSCSVILIAGNWAFSLIEKCQNCYSGLDLFWHDNIFAKPRTKMTTVSRFSRQNDAILRALNVVPWENLVLVVVLVLESKGPYCRCRSRSRRRRWSQSRRRSRSRRRRRSRSRRGRVRVRRLGLGFKVIRDLSAPFQSFLNKVLLSAFVPQTWNSVHQMVTGP